jgi:hypothetical protein
MKNLYCDTFCKGSDMREGCHLILQLFSLLFTAKI